RTDFGSRYVSLGIFRSDRSSPIVLLSRATTPRASDTNCCCHRCSSPVHRQLDTAKICLAINYSFVIIAAVYEKDVLLFWSWAAVDPADWVRSSNIFWIKSFLSGASNHRADYCDHGRGSTKRLRSAPRVFAQPVLQRSKCLRCASMG